jgi:hypothetical protein
MLSGKSSRMTWNFLIRVGSTALTPGGENVGKHEPGARSRLAGVAGLGTIKTTVTAPRPSSDGSDSDA